MTWILSDQEGLPMTWILSDLLLKTFGFYTMSWTLNIVQNLILGLESTVSAPGGAHFGFQDL